MLHAATFILSLTASIALAQEPKLETLTPTAPIGEVTLYQGRAMVSRMAAAPEREGLFELRFTNLPAAIDADSVQATVSAPKGGAKLLDVRFESTRLPNDANSNPELKKAIEDLEAAQRAGQVLALRGQRLKDQNDLLNAIAAKTATESAKDFGSKSLDPAALAAQVEWLPDPCCQAGLLTVTAGARPVLVFTGCDSTKARTNGTLWISLDEGASWSIKQPLTTGFFAYSAPVDLGGGRIGVLAEADEYRRIRFIPVTLAVPAR